MIELKARQSRILSVVLLAMVAVEALALVYLKALPFSRITVINTATEGDLYWEPTPGRRSAFTDSHGVRHVIVAADYEPLRHYANDIRDELGAVLAGATSDLERAVTLRKWARRQYRFEPGLGTSRMFDYSALRRARLREGGLCDAFATLYVGAAIASNIPARLVHLNTSGGTDSLGHYTTEVYLGDLGKWIVMDPLYNCYYTADGRPLSALDIHRFSREGRGSALIKVQVVRDGVTTEPHRLQIDSYYRHFQIVNRTDFDTYRLSLFGKRLRFVNWVGDGAGPLGRREAVLRVVLFFVWPAAGLIVAAILIIGYRPRTSRLQIVGRKPIRPEFRE